MGDYVDEDGIGRTFTPAQAEQEDYRQQLAKRDAERVWVHAAASQWTLLDSLDRERCWRPYPAKAEDDAIIGKRLLPEDLKRIYELHPEFLRIKS